METQIWNLLIVMSKVVFYLGYATLVGTAFVGRLMLSPNQKNLAPFSQSSISTLIFVGGLAALLSIVMGFLANIGAMAEEGLGGMLDPFMLELM